MKRKDPSRSSLPTVCWYIPRETE
uniref:Uncharacterized protein n=1 Tax=Arundo donax TaxID=35708 RepID=A0A0A9BFF7_ARUDO